jgi:hypothetical protein
MRYEVVEPEDKKLKTDEWTIHDTKPAKNQEPNVIVISNCLPDAEKLAKHFCAIVNYKDGLDG